jgi:hypothetical protein
MPPGGLVQKVGAKQGSVDIDEEVAGVAAFVRREIHGLFLFLSPSPPRVRTPRALPKMKI